MAMLQRDRAQIYYEKVTVEGDGPWITLINGHMRPSRDFRLMRSQLLELGMKVLVVDNRDSGQSTAEADYDVLDMCADIQAIWDEEGITETHVLGISMGGLIAQGLALEDRKRVLSLILISTFADPSWMLSEEPGWGIEPRDNEEVLSKYVSPRFYQANRRLIQIMAEQISKEVKESRFLSRAKRQRLATRDFFLDGLEGVDCPAVVIHGREDGIVDVASARHLNEKLPKSELVLLEGVGHLIMAEASGDLFQVCRDFIQNQFVDG